MPLSAIAINCSLKADGESSTDTMIGVLADAFGKHSVSVIETVRVAALNIKPGVTSDEGDGDDWPELKTKILAADILIFGTPIWMGQPGSIAKRIMERMDAFLSETDEASRMPSFGKVVVLAIVGNEDGAHNCTAQMLQAMVDVGWSVAGGAACYWVGEAMGDVDFKDLTETPDKVLETAAMAASNAAHLAGLLQANPYPGIPE